MHMKIILFFALMLAGCGKPKPTPAEPTSTEGDRYKELTDRLSQFLDDGWVVSRGANTNRGDSLFFSGLAMYGLPCTAGEPIAKAMETQLKTGALVRYPGNKDTVSLDGQLGLYRGIAGRIQRCNEAQRWHNALAAAKLPSLVLGYDAVRKSVLQHVGLGDGPSEAERLRLEADSTVEAVGAQDTHLPCFRVHFSLVAMQTLVDLGGKISQPGKDLFCLRAKGTRIATVEHFCGRDDLSGYLDNFKTDEWIYAHQRCPGWESPDADGSQEPAVDFFEAYQDKALGE